MSKTGPGKFGGSRATVRKRAQRKRAVANTTTIPVRKKKVEATKPMKPIQSPQEKQMQMMAYEVLGIATQLRKAANAFSGSFDKHHAIVEDADRAMKTLHGMLKDNKAKEQFKKEA
jgi:hypothetical protein